GGEPLSRRKALAGRGVQGDPVGRAVGTARRGEPRHGQGGLEAEDAAAAHRRRAGNRGRRRLQRRGQRLVQGLRLEDRAGALEVQLRGGRERAGRLVHGEREAICRGGGGRQQPDQREARQQCLRLRVAVTT